MVQILLHLLSKPQPKKKTKKQKNKTKQNKQKKQTNKQTIIK